MSRVGPGGAFAADHVPLAPDNWLTGADHFAWLEYETNLRVARRQPKTIDNYGSGVAQLAQWLADPANAPRPAGGAAATVTTATKSEISRFLVHLAETRSDATALNRFRALRAFYNFLAAEEIMAKSPMARIPAPEPAEIKPRILSKAEITALLDTCRPRRRRAPLGAFTDKRDLAILAIMLSPGGPRREEIAGLTTADINLRNDDILVHGKGRKDRLIPMGPEVKRYLLAYLRVREAHPRAHLAALWLGKREGFNHRGIALMIARRSLAAGCPVHPHELRHTAYHWFRMGGGDADQAQELFGWSDLQMVLVYGRTAASERARQAGRNINVLAGL